MGFNGTPFNDDQLDYMRSLAKIPPEKLSWCGWGRAGDKFCCGDPGCPGKTEGKTAADKMKVWCPVCRNWPRNGVITHVITCGRLAHAAIKRGVEAMTQLKWKACIAPNTFEARDESGAVFLVTRSKMQTERAWSVSVNGVRWRGRRRVRKFATFEGARVAVESSLVPRKLGPMLLPSSEDK